MGTPGGTKNDTYCKFLLSDLNAIGQTGLLRPDLVATALDTLHGASSGTGLVFSRTADGESRFGDDRLRNFLKNQDLTVGDLRRRIETDADELGHRGVLSDQDRELVTYVCQHTVTAADEEYVQRANTAAAETDEGSAFTEHAQRESDQDDEMVKTIANKLLEQQESVRDPAVDPEVPLVFTRFLDGDDQNFDAGNCVEVTPYEYFSAANGRDWCVSWDHYAHADFALTGEEKNFVVNSFDLFAAHFKPGASEARRLLDAATNNFVQGEIGKLRARIKTMEDAAAAQPVRAAGSEWLQEVIDTAEELKYDNQRTTGDIVRLKLALARAALKRPGSATRNEDAAYAKYDKMAHWLQEHQDLAGTAAQPHAADEETMMMCVLRTAMECDAKRRRTQ